MLSSYKVLDHGYCKLIPKGCWGDDEIIVESARMSTDGGFVSWDPYPKHPKGDQGLISFLWQHKHMTPFEMAGLTVEVQAPIMVFREWHRHRTQCLVGDTKITCLSPRLKGSTNVAYVRTIKHIFETKHGIPIENTYIVNKNGTPVTRKRELKIPFRTGAKAHCQGRMLRVLDESSGLFIPAPMEDVWESGIKEVFQISARGQSIRASQDHPFYTKDGWKLVKELRIGDQLAVIGKVASHDRPLPPSLRAGIGVWTTMMRSRIISEFDFCYVCGDRFRFIDLELDHVVPVCDDLLKALDPSNLKPICLLCHRLKINEEQPDRHGQTRLGIRWKRLDEMPIRVGEEMTYDISVNGPKNFLANGFVVHNSYNEMSARYSELPNLFYIPSVERLMAGAQSKANKQGSQEGFSAKEAFDLRGDLIHATQCSREAYQRLLRAGLSRELARLVVPVNQYSRMRASANLRNWLAFLTLRQDPSAQWEIRQYANAVASLVKALFPRTFDLFSPIPSFNQSLKHKSPLLGLTS